MTKAPLAPYPALRLRRLRQADWIRRLVRETVLTPADLIWSMVVHEGEGKVPVGSMPGIERLSVKECANAAREAARLGIPAIAVFPHIDGAKKDATGALAHDPDGLVARAVKAMKDAAPEVGIMCDVALDPFTDHGHDGLLENGRVVNDATVEALVSQGLIDRTFAAAREHGAAVPAMPEQLTVKEATGPLPAKVVRTVPRAGLWAMQTPQVMRRAGHCTSSTRRW